MNIKSIVLWKIVQKSLETFKWGSQISTVFKVSFRDVRRWSTKVVQPTTTQRRGIAPLQALNLALENDAQNGQWKSICIYIDSTFICFLENTLHIMYPRHPNTSKKEGIWTLKPYPKHQTSGDVWMSRGIYIYIHIHIHMCALFLGGCLCFFPPQRGVQLEDSPQQNAGCWGPERISWSTRRGGAKGETGGVFREAPPFFGGLKLSGRVWDWDSRKDPWMYGICTYINGWFLW